MLDACSRRYLDRPTEPDEVADRLNTPGSDPRYDSLLVDGAAAEVFGFGHVWPAGDAEVRCFARVHPDARGRGVGTLLLTRLRARAAEHVLRPAAAPVLTATNWAADEQAGPLFRALGFTEQRFFLRMTADLRDGPAAAAHWPAGVQVREFRDHADDDALFAAFAEAFADHWGQQRPDRSQWWYDHRDSASAAFDPTLWFLATDGGEIAGFVLGTAEQTTGQISQLGVRPRWRGRGLGAALLAHALDTFTGRGLDQARLTVDTANVTTALRLYLKAGMRPEPAFTIWGTPLHAARLDTPPSA